MQGAHRAALVVSLITITITLAGATAPDVGVADTKRSRIPLASGDWPQQGRNPRKTGFNREETTITSTNVAQLVPEWRAPVSRFDYGAGAVVANGFVYYGSDFGMSVFPLDCGTGGVVCEPLWETDENGQRGPVVIGDLVFTGGGSFVNAYPALGCGQPVCEPVMQLGPIGNFVWTITGAGDVVVVTTQTYSWPEPGVFVFDLSTCTMDPCEPSWTGKVGAHELGSVAVARGSVYVGGDHNMYVFDLAGCGEELCSGSWMGLTGRVGHADTTPSVADGFVYLLSAAVDPNDRSLSAYHANGCAHITCKATWGADVGVVSAGASLAVAQGTVFVSEYGRLDAFRARGCGGPLMCEPDWVGEASGLHPYPAPTVAADVVYAGVDAAAIAAFTTSCDTEVCEPLALLQAPEVGVATRVFVSNGKLIVAGTAAIEVFGLP